MTIKLFGSPRGVVAADGKPNPKPAHESTLLVQVERERDEISGKHLVEYYYTAEFDYSDIPTCTATGGAAGGAGATVLLPAIPATARVLDAYVEVTTAFVNDAGTQDIDLVALNTTSLFADAAITAAAGMTQAVQLTLTEGTPNTVANVFPLKFTSVVIPKVCFAGANTVKYTAGAMRLYVKLLSNFEA